MRSVVCSVLLLPPDTISLEAWRRALRGLKVQILEATASGIAASAKQRVDIAVGRWTRESVDSIRAMHPAVRLVHCESHVPSSLVESIAHGAQLEYAADTSALRGVITRLTRPEREAARFALTGLTVRLRDGGEHPLNDVSSTGLGFALADGTDVSGFLPGEQLAGLSVLRGDRVLLEGVEARIARLTPTDGSYHVGCTLHRAPLSQSQVAVIRDPAACAGLLQAAARAKHMLLRRVSGAGLDLECRRARLDLTAGELELTVPEHDFAVFDVIEGQFELSGTLYRFRSACSHVAPLKLRLPSLMEVVQQRVAPRSHASPLLRVSFTSPFAAGRLERQVLDVSASGLSFDIDGLTDPLPVGTCIDDLTVLLGQRELRLRGQVRYVIDRAPELRCGIELTLSASEREQLLELILLDRYPNIDPRGIDFDALLSFMREARYLDEKREEAIRPLYPEAQQIHAALRRDPQGLASTLVLRDGERLVGHIAGLRAYPRTWMFHHLAALPGHRAAGVLSVAVMDQLLHDSSCEFFRMWFLTSARFPSRVFGGFARKLPNGPFSDIRPYAHAVLSTADWAHVDSELEVSEARPDELLLLERRLLLTLPALVVQAEELTRTGLKLAALDERYRRLGAYRERRVLALRRAGRVLGFSLAEISSPGLNLADALSSFRIVLSEQARESEHAEARRALIAATVDAYARTGRKLARCLIVPEEAADYAALGVKLDAEQSLSWTCHRSHFQAFSEHMRAFFEELVARDAGLERSTSAA